MINRLIDSAIRDGKSVYQFHWELNPMKLMIMGEDPNLSIIDIKYLYLETFAKWAIYKTCNSIGAEEKQIYIDELLSNNDTDEGWDTYLEYMSILETYRHLL